MFKSAPVLDLAILRILAVGLQLGLLVADKGYGQAALAEIAKLPDSYYYPLPLLQLILLPFGVSEPSLSTMETVHIIAILSGILALIGLFTNLSLGIFAFSCTFVHLWMVSHSDIHHTEAMMMISLTVLALSPAGKCLSIDRLLFRRNFPQRNLLEERDDLARWPILTIQWIFAMMYASAAYAKISFGGLDWPNGYTLQYYLAVDGLRWGSPLGVWLSQHHTFVMLSQWGVILFQMTFFLSILVPRLKWIYVPAGMFMHVGIYILLSAPFFQWIALYAAFVPWTQLIRGWQERSRKVTSKSDFSPPRAETPARQ